MSLDIQSPYTFYIDMKRFSVLAFAVLFAFGCSDPISVDNEVPAVENGRFTPPNPATKNLTIAEIVVSQVNSTGEFSVLLAALAEAELVDAVSGRTIFTVVAPTNAAFNALGINEHNVGDVDGLADILLYHVTPGRFTAEIVLQQNKLTMANGGMLTVNTNPPSFTDANGRTANIVYTDIAARNGIIHVIDTVVLP